MSRSDRSNVDISNVLAGLIGGSLTLAGQHVLNIAHDRRTQRIVLISGRTDIREKLMQRIHALAQITGDYIEASMRGSLDEQHGNPCVSG